MFCMLVFLTAFLKLEFCSLLNKVMYNAINAYAEDYRYVMPYFCHYHISPCQNKGASWSWSYGSCIYNYLCNECLSSLKLRVRNPVLELEFFFPEFNIRLYDKNSESNYFFFPAPKSEYFFQQHWESEPSS